MALTFSSRGAKRTRKENNQRSSKVSEFKQALVLEDRVTKGKGDSDEFQIIKQKRYYTALDLSLEVAKVILSRQPINCDSCDFHAI